MIWTFEEYVLGSQGNEHGIISNDLDDSAEGELYVVLSEHLGIYPASEWGMPHYLPIGGGMGEIRWKCADKQFRAYGSFADGKRFRIWMIATKDRKRKGHQATDPPEAIEKARKRRKEFELHRIGRLRVYE